MPLSVVPVCPRVESLESRRLMSSDWGGAPRLIRQDLAADVFSTTTGAGQVVAVIDSGINYNHPALGGGYGTGYKVIAGYDFADNDTDPMDSSGHGTEVAGVVAASEFMVNGSRYRGVAPDAKLVALRVDSGDGFVPDARVEAAFQWIINHPELNISVVNISYGDGHYNDPYSSTFYGDEIATLAARGVSIVAASGNGGVADGPGIDGPASDANVIAVGSVSQFDVISDFGERGKLISVMAPGEDVYTTLLGNIYGEVVGTSFSAPAVAGAVALARQLDPTLTLKDLRSALAGSGETIQDGDDEVGASTTLRYARLDLYSLLKLVTARKPSSPADLPLFGKNGNNNSIVVDSFGVTHFVYFDSSNLTMKYATRSASGTWSTLSNIDTSALNQGIYVSMAVDAFGKPAVAYFDGNAGDLKFAQWNGDVWEKQTLDSAGSVGLYPSIVFDSADNPAISYYRKTSGDLRVARRDSENVWNVQTVDTRGDSGRSTAIAVDAGGKLGVVYENSTTGHLKFAKDVLGGSWSLLNVDTTITGVSFMSLAFDSAGRAVVSYYDATPADLKIARQIVAGGGTWTKTTLATKGAVGLYTSLWLDPNDTANVLFYDRRVGGTFKAVIDTANAFSIMPVVSNSGKFLTTALDVTTGRRIYTAFNTATSQLDVTVLA